MCKIVIEKQLVRGCLFDMDGTLVDSTLVVERTWHRFADRHFLDVHAVLREAHGRPTRETVSFFAPKHVDAASETARLIAEEVSDVVGIRAIPGAREVLMSLPEHQWAVVTSASRELAIRRMRAAQLPIPDVLISADDVKEGKPSPEGYLMAAERLGVRLEEAVVFEDARPGIQAAQNANILVYAVGQDAQIAEELKVKRISDFSGLEISSDRASGFVQLSIPTREALLSTAKIL